MSVSDALQPVRQALHNVRACRSLLGCDGWDWLIEQQRQRMADLTREVMEDELTHSQREQSIREYRTIKRLVELPEQQLHANTATLEAANTSADEDGVPP